MKKSTMKRSCFFFFLLIIFFSYTTKASYSFDNYTKDQGLNDNYINAVYEDSRGFILIGTRSGLKTFDGRYFSSIIFPDTVVPGIGINYITSISEDKNNNLWLGCPSGVIRYKIETDEFKYYSLNKNNPELITYNNVVDIIVTRNNEIWIGTMNGLNYYDSQRDEFVRIEDHDKTTDRSLPDYVYYMSEDTKGNVYVSMRYRGLKYIEAGTHKAISLLNVDDYISNNNIHAAMVDSRNNIWALSRENGIWIKRVGDSSFTQYTLKNTEDQQMLQNAVFSCISEDSFGNIWVGTFGDGIFIIDPEEQILVENSERPENVDRLKLKSVDQIVRDSRNNMWVASHGAGVSIHSPIKSQINYYFNTGQQNSLPGNIVSCFFEDSYGNMWVGIDGNGFCLFNKETGSFKSYTKDDGLSANSIMDIVQVDKRTLAISTWSGGINLFDIFTHTFTSYSQLPDDDVVNNIYDMYLDTVNNYLWCGSYINGVQIFDLSSRSFLGRNKLDSIYPEWNEKSFIAKIFKDKKDNIWSLGTIEVSRYNDGEVYNYSSSQNDCPGIGNSHDVYIDKQERIWVATDFGLAVYNNLTDCFTPKHLNIEENVVSIIEDGKDNIWFTTRTGLYRYNPEQETLENISIKWGVPDMQYFNRSAYRATDGYLYFGGVEGFIMLHEDSSYNHNIDPSVYITGLSIYNRKQTLSTERSPLQTDISYSSTITLDYDQSFISFDFVALNYIDSRKSKYLYKLEGFDKEWNEINAEPTANYTNVPPGKYTFKVKTTNSDGIWSDKEYGLGIIINPPWWKTIWFKITASLAIVILILLIIKYRERAIKAQNKLLGSLVEERTTELKSANEMLKDRNSDLKCQKEEIQQHLNELREKQMVIQMKNSDLQEALEVKDKLMTIIAHDFKNPLAALIGFTDILEQKGDSLEVGKRKKYYTMISASARRILEQMNNVLTWSSGKNDSIKYKPEEVNLETIILDVLSLLNESALQNRINLRTKFSFEHFAFVDARMVSIVLRNLINNSIKYSEKDSEIVISLEENQGNIIVRVSDEGIGIEQDVLEEILSADFKSSVPNKGFGLQIVKSFVAKNKGVLSIKSQSQKGTEVCIELPKGEKKIPYTEVTKMYEQEFVSIDFEEMEQDSMPKMLIIDDNEEITTYLKDTFGDAFQIYTAYDGQKGYSMAQSVVPDVILSDVDMPLLNGIELCKLVKNNIITNHIPVLLISAKTQDGDQMEGLQYGADDYITKPFNVHILKQKVLNLISLRAKLSDTDKNEAKNNITLDLPESTEDKLLKKVNQIITEHISKQNFSVEVLAQEANMSRSQLYRKFKATMGISPMDYIKNLRLQKAMEMLKTGKYRISEIADEVGFSDSAYFSRCFTAAFGAPPSNYVPKKG